MPVRTYTLRLLGGLLGCLALTACSDGEGGQQQQSSSGPAIRNAPTNQGQPAQAQEDGTVVLDGSELPPLPTSLGNRLFDTVVRVNEDGSVTRKVIETTPEQRERGAKMTADLEQFLSKHAEKPSEQAIADWRASWGLPTLEETARYTEELMKLPYDIILDDSLEDAVDIDVKGLGEAGLRVLEGSQALAASGFGYIADDDAGNGNYPIIYPNTNGGACAPYMPGGVGTMMYWTGQEYRGHVLCIINIWKSDAGVLKFNHPSYWTHGTDVDSYCAYNVNRVDSGTSTTCNTDGTNGFWKCGAWSGNFLDGKTHTCFDPSATAP